RSSSESRPTSSRGRGPGLAAPRNLPRSQKCADALKCKWGDHRTLFCWSALTHTKAHKPTYRTSGSLGKADFNDWRNAQIGDLLHPLYPKGSANQNYYYMLAKPSS